MDAVSFSGQKMQLKIVMGIERVDQLFYTCMVFSNKLFYKKVRCCVSAVRGCEAVCPRDEDGTSRVPVPSRSLVTCCGPVRCGARGPLRVPFVQAEDYLCAAGWDAHISLQRAEGCCGYCPGKNKYIEFSFLNVLLVE